MKKLGKRMDVFFRKLIDERRAGSPFSLNYTNPTFLSEYSNMKPLTLNSNCSIVFACMFNKHYCGGDDTCKNRYICSHLRVGKCLIRLTTQEC
ncbi:Uncharacterized protein TCM_019142 [Theobroma cacao]|uniref:Uncharacterized protein n=1 Tax=Theobroma cacao TaxID=3641 RepID=A0A061EGY9_THECC|nr:Uncharacterized protein TCM_019142 [Theobroma cacao]